MSKKIRTSNSSPIRVDFLPVRTVGLAGRIGMTFAPGKKGIGVTADWDRDLSTDLERLYRVYSTAILVTLLEPQEREFLHIGTLLEEAATAHLEVLELPIPRWRRTGVASRAGVPGEYDRRGECRAPQHRHSLPRWARALGSRCRGVLARSKC